MPAVVLDPRGAEQDGGGPRLAYLKQLRLQLSSTYYSMSQALGLRRMQDYLQGTTNLPSSTSPLWLLGLRYQTSVGDDKHNESLEQEMLRAILSDFMSRIWITYRRDFAPIGQSGLTSDVGWGCTFRSGQMCLAQEVAHILRWFRDAPGEQHPFSMHSLCAAGRPYGVVPGEWLGPTGLCHTLALLVERVQPGGLRARTIASLGGGAPTLYPAQLCEALRQQGDASTSQPSAGGAAAAAPTPGLLVLVPLMLGLHGKLNPQYIRQLQAVMSCPQSLGIVGGRPSSSLYFVGYQDARVLYLDPHEVQEVPPVDAGDLSSYFCSTLRSMPLAAIDPSMALALYCSSPDDLEDLCVRLKDLEAGAHGAPLLCVSDAQEAPPWEVEAHIDSVDGSQGPVSEQGKDEWEVL